jgi:arylsulfatase A-like enzyme
VLALVFGCARTAEPGRPDLVLVVIDTLRADHLSLHGHPRETAPHLARLAGERGLLFERAYSHAGWTLPSMGSLLTGRLRPSTVLRAMPSTAGASAASRRRSRPSPRRSRPPAIAARPS